MFNSHLSNESYVAGCVPTLADVDIYKSFNGVKPEAKWAHISRWYAHLTKLGVDPRAWPAEWRLVEEKQEAAEEQVAVEKPSAEATEDDDVDLFGEETAEDKAANEARKAAAEGSKKAAPVSTSAVIFDIKPWDEETDMDALEAGVRAVTFPSLEWKAGERVHVVGKIFALRILCHFTDDVFAVEEDLKGAIELLEDMVQSVDIFAWNRR